MEITNWPYYAAGYLRHLIPQVIYLFMMIGCTLIIWGGLDEKMANKGYKYAVGSVAACVQGWFLYTPNPFKDTFGGVYHLDAYSNSIINSLSFTPLEEYSMSIYGHYGNL